MKKIIFMYLCFITFYSCEKEPEIVGGMTVSTYFKITEFKIYDNVAVDLNNDNISNSNMLLEFTNYFNNTYDLVILKNSNLTLLSFYIPKQNIFLEYNCCPSGFVEFSKNGFVLNQEKKEKVIENQVIDSDTKIISFSKIDNLNYKLILEKKYYDFILNTYSSNVYEIKYEIMN